MGRLNSVFRTSFESDHAAQGVRSAIVSVPVQNLIRPIGRPLPRAKQPASQRGHRRSCFMLEQPFRGADFIGASGLAASSGSIAGVASPARLSGRFAVWSTAPLRLLTPRKWFDASPRPRSQRSGPHPSRAGLACAKSRRDGDTMVIYNTGVPPHCAVKEWEISFAACSLTGRDLTIVPDCWLI